MDLQTGRNELDKLLNHSPLEDIFIKGRYLQSDAHDNGCDQEEHMHLYRKILEDWNPNTETVLLSKQGSRRLEQNLEEPDKEFTIPELYDNGIAYWMVREKGHNLH